MGGREDFILMLDSVFVAPPIYDDSYYGYRIHEITEMQVARMGNYAHGNQPAQHIIYLYDWVDEPWKTQEWVRETMNRLYSSAPDGYCGDEDNGQTSAWYVFSALGFYPVCPGSGEYAFGAPYLPYMSLDLGNGKKLNITAKGVSDKNRYVKSITLNGEPIKGNFITNEQIMNGGELVYTMTSKKVNKR
jgi:predicted alpha-1,2-mannosidase